MIKKKLLLGHFTRTGEQGSFNHVFTHKLEDGGEICLEACMGGYCVARYDGKLDLVGEKVCTNIESYPGSVIAPGFSILTGEALISALHLANKLL